MISSEIDFINLLYHEEKCFYNINLVNVTLKLYKVLGSESKIDQSHNLCSDNRQNIPDLLNDVQYASSPDGCLKLELPK